MSYVRKQSSDNIKLQAEEIHSTKYLLIVLNIL